MNTKWSREKIISDLQSLFSSGFHISSTSVNRKNPKLYEAACRYFGSWKKVVEQTGFESDVQRADWNPTKVLCEIKKLYKQNKSLIYADIVKHNCSLLNAATRYFYSWRNAVKKAGIKPQYRHKYLTKSNIIKAIRERKSQGKRINPHSVDKENQGLYVAARKKFGSWKKAVEAAGLVLDDYQEKTKWTNKKIVTKIKEIKASGEDINSASIGRKHYSFYNQAVKRFGSWDEVLLAAGFDPHKIRKNGFWTKELVIERIQERDKKRQTLHTRDMQNTSLYANARKYFGSWREAMDAADVKWRKKQSFMGEDILCRLLLSFFPHADFYQHKKFDWLRGPKNKPMHLDIFSEKLNLAVEFQGPSHFYPIYGFEGLQKQKRRDEKKKRLCEKRGINFLAVRYNKLATKSISDQLLRMNLKHTYSDKTNHLCKLYQNAYSRNLKEKKCLC